MTAWSRARTRPRVPALALRLAYRWGLVIGAYSRSVVGARHRVEGFDRIPAGPRIWVSWHGHNLIALASRRLLPLDGGAESEHVDGRGRAFVPPGIVGATARGWVHGAGAASVSAALEERSATPALREMLGYLASGQDALIAVDGPSGPPHRVRPGAIWLAKRSGRPIVPTGCAATPAVRYPRWDRHLIPLPGARTVVAVGEPLSVDPGEPLDGPISLELARRIDAAAVAARQCLTQERRPSHGP